MISATYIIDGGLCRSGYFYALFDPERTIQRNRVPENYIIDHDCDGKPYTRAKQVARCGNAVTPPIATVLVRVNLPEYCV